MVWSRIQLHSFASGYLIIPAPFVEKPLFSPLNSVVENQLTIDVWVYFCTLNSIPLIYQIRSDQSLSRVRLFATPWIAARQASLSITNSRSSLRLTSIESVMPSSHLILCCPLLLLPPIPLSIRVFPMTQLFAWGGQSTGVSALASFLPKKSQGWSPSEWTGWISTDL